MRPWKPAVVCMVVVFLGVATWLLWRARSSPTGGGTYTVEFVWDHGSSRAKLAGRSAKAPIDSALRDLVLSEAEKVVSDRIPRTGLASAQGFLELTVVGPSPAFVQIHELWITQPDISRIMAAVEKEDVSELQRLISLVQNVNVKQPPALRTPLFMGAAGNHSKSVEILIQLGADPNTPDIDGNTALSLAGVNGNAKIIGMLIHAGANVNSQDSAGLTPLMLAAIGGHVEAVRALVLGGADPKLRTPSGETALSLAQKNHQERIIALLARHSHP